MSIEIKSLTNGTPTRDNSLVAQNDNFNILPTANDVYNLYTVPSGTSVIIKNIRLTNVDPANTVKVNVYFNRANSLTQNRRIRISPQDLALPPGFTYLEDGEITLDPGDAIQAKADRARAIQFLISGVEREVI